MGMLSRLMNLGGKLGVIRIVSTTAPAPPGKIPTRKITLKDLATEIRSEEVRMLTELPAELSVDFAKVFEAAGIKPLPHGWTVERLEQVLATEQFKTMDRVSVQKALLGMLSADKAHVHEVVQDAVSRDKALDAFEDFARKKMDDRGSVREMKVAELENQVKALQEQCAKLREESQDDRRKWKQWHDRKITREKAMAEAIGFLVQDSVITVDHDHG